MFIYYSQKMKIHARSFHHDSTLSHASREKIALLENCKIKYVKLDDWMSKSPGLASMDYAIWNYLKQTVNKFNIQNLDEPGKCLVGQWRKFEQDYIEKKLARWSKTFF